MKKVFTKLGVIMMTLSMFTFSSCEELKDLLKFDFDLEGETIEIVVAELEVGEGVEIGKEQFEKSLEQIIKENQPDADLSKIKAIKLSNISMQIVKNGDEGNNFQNLGSIYTEVRASGLNDLLVAKKENINSDVPQYRLDLPVEGGSIDVKNYFSKTDFEYVVKADVVKETTKELTIQIKADYSFTFGL